MALRTSQDSRVKKQLFKNQGQYAHPLLTAGLSRCSAAGPQHTVASAHSLFSRCVNKQVACLAIASASCG